MPHIRTSVLDFLQKRFRSLIQPLHNQQADLRIELSELARESLARSTELERQIDSLTESVLASRWLDHPHHFSSRLEIGHWLNSLGLTGHGVEVGVYRGEFSNLLLRTWKGQLLTSVDPWREFPKSEYVDACNFTQAEHDQNFRDTARLLSRFGSRSQILRQPSSEAATTFGDASLDFVYLDAQHHFEAVRDDIEVWFPKIRQGGVIGGHDYLDGTLPSGRYGVKSAVAEFSSREGVDVIVTREADWPSWFARIA